MSRYIPDDWGRYYRSCHLCGSRYHMSEGGCDCSDDLVCQCSDPSKADWGLSGGSGFCEGEVRCSVCGSGPLEDLGSFITYHRARKDHKDKTVLKGDFYRKEVSIGYFQGGKFQRKITKRKVTESQYDNRHQIELQRQARELKLMNVRMRGSDRR